MSGYGVCCGGCGTVVVWKGLGEVDVVAVGGARDEKLDEGEAVGPFGVAFTVRWSEGDGEWVATEGRYPSLSWLAGSPTKALAGLIRVMGEKEEK